MSYREQYRILLKNISRFKSGERFTVSEVIVSPQANVGKTFFKEVANGSIGNVRHIGKKNGVDEYQTI
jgi:hypothetical protein